jgi:hypothetical protein
MIKYLAGVLTVIAVGVLLVAYGLLGSRASAFSNQNPYPYGMQPAGMQLAYPNGMQPAYPGYPYGMQQAYPYGTPYVANGVVATPINAVAPVREVQTVRTVQAAPQRVVTRTVRRAPGRDWKKTAMVIGGTTAAGAGIGGIFGGKKGALIGAAIGGGGATIYETTKNRGY